MAKKKATRKKRSATKREPSGDFMEVGQEVVPGMRLRAICRGHQGTIGRIAWSPCGRFIASPSQDMTRCVAEKSEELLCSVQSRDWAADAQQRRLAITESKEKS